MSTSNRVVDSDKIWACLITNEAYLPGLLTLEFSLRRVKSKYPLVALHTSSLPDKTLHALSARDIPTQQVPYLFPGPPSPPPSPTSATSNNTQTPATIWYANDPRFLASFSKLAVFSLTAYTRIVLLDADMLVRQNMDELFTLPLLHDHAPSTNTNTDKHNNRLPIFAASHACLCNPLHFPHYPPTWTPANCAFTQQELNNNTDPSSAALTSGGDPDAGLGLLNGGLLVVAPDRGVYREIEGLLRRSTPATLPFADQSLLAEGFRGRWGALEWVYNGLKTMRWKGVHAGLWRDENVKNVHYILTPKPWELVVPGKDTSKGQVEETDRWWWEIDSERRRWEVERGVDQ